MNYMNLSIQTAFKSLEAISQNSKNVDKKFTNNVQIGQAAIIIVIDKA